MEIKTGSWNERKLHQENINAMLFTHFLEIFSVSPIFLSTDPAALTEWIWDVQCFTVWYDLRCRGKVPRIGKKRNYNLELEMSDQQIQKKYISSPRLIQYSEILGKFSSGLSGILQWEHLTPRLRYGGQFRNTLNREVEYPEKEPIHRGRYKISMDYLARNECTKTRNCNFQWLNHANVFLTRKWKLNFKICRRW